MAEGKRILLVEDNPGDVALLRARLSDLPWVEIAAEAATCAGALAILEQHQFDAVLLDLGLPDSSGIDTLRAVSNATTSPLVVLTGESDQEIALKAIKAGCQDYLVKGHFDSETLGRALRYSIERSRVLDSMRVSEQRYALATAGARDGLWDWEVKSGQIDFSERWKKILGYAPDELPNTLESWFDNVHPDDVMALRTSTHKHLEGKTPYFECEYRMRHRDGHYCWVMTRGVAVRGRDGKAERIAGSQTDVNERHRLEEQLAHEASHDSLTGCPNRSHAMRVLSRAIEEVSRNTREQFSVLFLDVDRFKQINDTFGHLVGDRLLIELARRVGACIRPTDTLARLAGDEFLLILMHPSTSAVRIAQRILNEMRAPCDIDGHQFSTSVSIGVAVITSAYRETAAVLHNADAALYRAKSLGGNTYQVFDEELHVKIVGRKVLEKELRHAIANNQIETHFQPIVSLREGKVVALEALARWRRGDQVVSCADFFLAAEKEGLAAHLSEQALRDSCKALTEWEQRGIVTEGLQMCINITQRQLMLNDLGDRIQQILDETHTPTSRIRVDVSERRWSANAAQAGRAVQALRMRGIAVDVDDFDERSAVQLLVRHPIDRVKLDHRLIHEGQADEHSVALMSGLINLVHQLGKKAVAEKVESRVEAELLRDLQCDFAQGFYFCPPLSAAETERFLASGQRWRLCPRQNPIVAAMQ